MAWTELTRPHYVRSGGRYASDTTHKEWALIAPFLPAPKRVGRPRTTELRDVFDAILYLATTGCQWRMLPNDFPPVSTVRRYFYDLRIPRKLGTYSTRSWALVPRHRGQPFHAKVGG